MIHTVKKKLKRTAQTVRRITKALKRMTRMKYESLDTFYIKVSNFL
jgi:hypothetical protein